MPRRRTAPAHAVAGPAEAGGPAPPDTLAAPLARLCLTYDTVPPADSRSLDHAPASSPPVPFGLLPNDSTRPRPAESLSKSKQIAVAESRQGGCVLLGSTPEDCPTIAPPAAFGRLPIDPTRPRPAESLSKSKQTAVADGCLGSCVLSCGTQCDDVWPSEALEAVLARLECYDEPWEPATDEEASNTRLQRPCDLYAPSLLCLRAARRHACSGRCSDGVGVSTANFVQPDGSVMLEAEWRSHVVSSLDRSAVVAAAAAGGGSAVAAWPEEGPDDVQATELAVTPASASSSICSDEVDEYEGSYSDAYD